MAPAARRNDRRHPEVGAQAPGSDAADAPYVPGYADLEATLGWLASADLVIGERLHASILAAACATPFVALEYRPKIRDFAKSIAMESQVIRTDQLAGLTDLIMYSLTSLDSIRADLETAVDEIRNLAIRLERSLR